MKPSADWETPAPLPTPYRFRVIADDEENHPEGPFIVQYYRGSILGGRWVGVLLFTERDEAEDYMKALADIGPSLTNACVAYLKTVHAEN